MDNQNSKSDSTTTTAAAATNGFHSENPNSDPSGNSSPPPPRTSRTPFSDLNQVDADLLLARTLQDQERAYMMLRMNNDGGGSYLQGDEDDFHDESDGDYDDDELGGSDADNGLDAFDVLDHHGGDEDDEDNEEDDIDGVELDADVYSSDEAYARALQDAEERDMAARLSALAGLGNRDDEDSESEDHGHSQDGWEEVDPDELSYEELLALGEVVGTESRGLSADTIASLPSVNYKTGSSQNGSNDSCVICRLDYDDGETLTLLSCKHSYHPECINNWLNINKVCPVCSTEVSTSGHS